MHYVKHHIMNVLAKNKRARFRDMKPPRVDSNAYSYHLTSLQKEGLVEKTEKQYRLSPKGLAYVDRISENQTALRHQPKIITMCLIYDAQGRVLLIPKKKQPFIGSWVFPHGKLHLEDLSIENAAKRELQEKLNIEANDSLAHAANVYIYANILGDLVSAVLAHVFTMQLASKITIERDVAWSDKAIRKSLKLGPAIEDIIELVQSDSVPPVKEFNVDW